MSGAYGKAASALYRVWYTTPAGHVLRVSLVDRECQKVICEPLGRNYRISMPLIAFCSGKNMKHLGGAA
ncbi:hypothetical protein ACX3VG_04540, partial [Escherichia coli]